MQLIEQQLETLLKGSHHPAESSVELQLVPTDKSTENLLKNPLTFNLLVMGGGSELL